MPAEFAAGTTQVIRKRFTDYPASAAWILTLHLAGAAVRSIAAVADGDDFIITIPASATAHTTGFIAGLYYWQMRVELSGVVHEVESGRVTITPNFAEAKPTEHQAWIERTIVVLRAYIENRTVAGIDTYAIAGRQVSKMSVREASGLLTHYEAQLARLKNPTAPFRSVLVSFTGTGTKQ